VEPLQVLHFVFQGALGAFLATLFWAEKWSDLKSFKSLRHILVGAIAGYIYSILYSEYNFPNLIVAVVVGWMGKDALEAIFERFMPKKGGGEG
jgi:uncharacterized membrane protein YeaQ/YmgE (transglycosylase-associated protein family)